MTAILLFFINETPFQDAKMRQFHRKSNQSVLARKIKSKIFVSYR